MNVPVSIFPKFLKTRNAEAHAATLATLGFERADLLIRGGYPVDETSSKDDFDRAAATYRAAGLGLASAITDLNEPGDSFVRILEGCARNTIPSLRLGAYPYVSGRYYDTVEHLRHTLAKLVDVAQATGVKLLIQVHGNTIHPSSSATMRLVDGFDPDWLGVYWDPGNMLRLDGYEKWELGLDILGPYLTYVGVKNCQWRLIDGRWQGDWASLEEGMVDWPEVISLLNKRNYGGGLSLHPFYATDAGAEATRRIREDLGYLKRLLADAASVPA